MLLSFLPPPAQRGVKPLAAGFGQFDWFTLFVERDGFPDVIHDHLTGVAPRHVRFKLLTDGVSNRAIHVIVQQSHKFFAFHSISS